jgi:DNA-binding NtrC family response regulator
MTYNRGMKRASLPIESGDSESLNKHPTLCRLNRQIRPMWVPNMARSNVLLIDGTDHIRDIMHQYIESENVCTVSVATLAEGFYEMVGKDFDVLVTDLRIGKMQEGFRLATAIRHLRPEAMIVAVSNSLGLQRVMKAISLKSRRYYQIA